MTSVYSKIIPLAAGSITILNFFFSIMPVVSDPPNWYSIISQGMKPEFKFISFFILAIISSLVIVKIIIRIDQSNLSISTKVAISAIFTAIFAWIVVFNIKVIVLSNSLADKNWIIFLASCLVFSLFSSYKLRLELRELGYQEYHNDFSSRHEVIPEKLFWTRFYTFWIVVVLGGMVYNLSIN